MGTVKTATLRTDAQNTALKSAKRSARSALCATWPWNLSRKVVTHVTHSAWKANARLSARTQTATNVTSLVTAKSQANAHLSAPRTASHVLNATWKLRRCKRLMREDEERCQE